MSSTLPPGRTVKKKMDLTPYHTVVFGFPVHSLRAPKGAPITLRTLGLVFSRVIAIRKSLGKHKIKEKWVSLVLDW